MSLDLILKIWSPYLILGHFFFFYSLGGEACAPYGGAATVTTVSDNKIYAKK